MKKKAKIYSQLASLPTGLASENVTSGCLVLEGGAFRGTYTSGVCDCLMMHDINLETTIGVSAGAMNGLLYTTGDIGRAGRTNLGYRHDSRYVGLKALRKDKGIIGFDFCFRELNATLPVHSDRLTTGKRRFIAVAASLKEARAEYFEAGKEEDIFQAVRASASMPYVSKPVLLHGQEYLDGGCSVKIPYQWALDHQFEKIIVVLTKEHGFRKEIKKGHKGLAKLLYPKYPKFQENLLNMASESNREKEECEQLAKEGRIFLIEPSKKVTVGRLEKDMEKLGELYWLGYHDCERMLPELKAYLAK